MGFFGKGDKQRTGSAGAREATARPTAPQEAFCRVCDQRRPFSRCWLRVGQIPQCPCCKTAFENPADVYKQNLPSCPRCGEFLEQPGFEYGLCDGCGSKFELTAGTKPSLLPTLKQRTEMDKHGKIWRRT